MIRSLQRRDFYYFIRANRADDFTLVPCDRGQIVSRKVVKVGRGSERGTIEVASIYCDAGGGQLGRTS